MHARVEDQLAELSARLDALERENAQLRQAIAAPTNDDHATGTAVQEPALRGSRRWMLRTAAGVAVAGAAASTLPGRKASAHHSTNNVDANSINAHRIVSNRWEDHQPAISAFHSLDDNPAILGSSVAPEWGTGVQGIAGYVGVHGIGSTGVWGVSDKPAFSGVYGENANGGNGVAGIGSGSEHAGVLGRNSSGPGIRGEGTTGVHGTGTSTSGYGGQFQGGRAQLRLVPRPSAGKPTGGTHSKGELYMDFHANLYVCTLGGSPGTWRKVTTTAT